MPSPDSAPWMIASSIQFRNPAFGIPRPPSCLAFPTPPASPAPLRDDSADRVTTRSGAADWYPRRFLRIETSEGFYPVARPSKPSHPPLCRQVSQSSSVREAFRHDGDLLPRHLHPRPRGRWQGELPRCPPPLPRPRAPLLRRDARVCGKRARCKAPSPSPRAPRGSEWAGLWILGCRPTPGPAPPTLALSRAFPRRRAGLPLSGAPGARDLAIQCPPDCLGYAGRYRPGGHSPGSGGPRPALSALETLSSGAELAGTAPAPALGSGSRKAGCARGPSTPARAADRPASGFLTSVVVAIMGERADRTGVAAAHPGSGLLWSGPRPRLTRPFRPLGFLSPRAVRARTPF